jgi:hypothetical protein
MIKLKKILKILLYIAPVPVLIFFLFAAYFAYDSRISEAGKLSDKVNKKIEQFIQEKRTSFELKELTDFEWDEVCFESADGGTYIDLSNQNLIDKIGFKPKFLFKSKYWVNDDNGLSGLLFIDRKNQKVHVAHQIHMLDGTFGVYVKASNKNAIYKNYGRYIGCHDSNEILSFSITIIDIQKNSTNQLNQ